VINLGDSRAVFVKKDNYEIQVITKDHVATDTDEKQKVEDRGGFIF
jgi:serine/threonine protein phosphatase PrpC